MRHDLVSVRFQNIEVVIQMSIPSTKSMKDAIAKVFARHGIPQQVNTDNGPPFTTKCSRTLLKK